MKGPIVNIKDLRVGDRFYFYNAKSIWLVDDVSWTVTRSDKHGITAISDTDFDTKKGMLYNKQTDCGFSYDSPIVYWRWIEQPKIFPSRWRLITQDEL